MSSSYLDPSLLPRRRAELLLEQMTVEEKCGQLTCAFPWTLINADGSDAAQMEKSAKEMVGSIAALNCDDPVTQAKLIKDMHLQNVRTTRLGIPYMFHSEALNGFVAGGHQVFPTGIGLASTWSPELVEAMAKIIGEQMYRVGVRQALAPVMDIALDPRWGRVHETYGEDPYLCGALSVAYTRGLQTDDLKNGVIATAKHFLAYGLPEGGINLSAVEIGSRRLRDLFAFPFEASIQEAKLRSVMNCYSEIDGVPVAASSEMLNELLRDKLGFEGFVSSDYSTTNHLVDRQRTVPDAAAAGIASIKAGLDLELAEQFAFGSTMAKEVREGRLDIEYVNTAVLRFLEAKFELGLFERPFPTEPIDLKTTAEEGSALSKELADRSVVLLKNDGILPLKKDTLKIALIGPHATNVTYQFPTYTYPAWREMAVRMARGELAGAVGLNATVSEWNDALFPPSDPETFARTRNQATSLADEVSRFVDDLQVIGDMPLTSPISSETFAAAKRAAEEADLVILALGGASLWFNSDRTEGEASDSADISLPKQQEKLADLVASVGKPVVACLIQGRGYSLPESVLNANAIVVGSFNGPFGPKALAEILFGEVEPSGRLPYSIPRHTGQIPVYHHQKLGSGRRNPPFVSPDLYLDMPATPQFGFGAGLAYTEFDLELVSATQETDTFGKSSIAVRVSNTGGRAGVSIVQLYARVNSFLVARPAQQLVGFARVELEPGESRTIEFELDATIFAYTNIERQFVVDPALIEFFAGFDSDDYRVKAELNMTGETRKVSSNERTFFSRVKID